MSLRLTLMKVLQVPALALAAMAVVAAGGCSSGSSSASVGTRPPARTITLTENDNGHRVRVHVGDRIVVTLHNTYWQLGTPSGSVLMVTDESAPPPTSASPCPSIPGTGCGTVTHASTVKSTGTATLSAHRTSCGEALRCSPGQSAWKVTVVAS